MSHYISMLWELELRSLTATQYQTLAKVITQVKAAGANGGSADRHCGGGPGCACFMRVAVKELKFSCHNMDIW